MNKIYWVIIKKHLKAILFLFVSINIVSIISFGIVFNEHANYISSQLKNNIFEYNEVDREQLCKIAQCKEVISLNISKIYIPNNNYKLESVKFHEHNFLQITDILYINDEYNFVIYNKESNTYFVLDNKKIVNGYLIILQILIPISLLIFFIPLYRSVLLEREEALINNAGNEALLANKTMINITENIHHELNTPLEVIDNKLEKIYRIINEYLLNEYNNYLKHNNYISKEDWKKHEKRDISKRLMTLEEDFDFIKTSSEQIYTVLEKMKGFKHLRYSNGNKSIKDICTGGFKIINISNTDFKYKIDSNLNNFKLKHDTLKNADLLSIIINHIKNSLEANADNILVLFTSYANEMLTFRIVDNGNGIPIDAKNNIFKANFSTKDNDNSIRGNGLYLNKKILNQCGGDVRVVSSSFKGTTIEISIKALLK